jgi:hypothetical protein
VLQVAGTNREHLTEKNFEPILGAALEYAYISYTKYCISSRHEQKAIRLFQITSIAATEAAYEVNTTSSLSKVSLNKP